MTHEWIEQYLKYEGVLACTNELRTWDRDATVRAFQTFGWVDSAVNGYDCERFTHEASGVTVLYDGGLLAIEYGGDSLDRLPEAYSDLFHSLNSLGWTKAEVYCDPNTAGSRLDHMGTAIPAMMDFDLELAPIHATGIPHPLDMDDIVARGEVLLRIPGTDPSQDDVLREMQSLGELVEVGQAHNQRFPLRSAAAPIELEDDNENDLEPLEQKLVMGGRSVVAQSQPPVLQPAKIIQTQTTEEPPKVAAIHRNPTPSEDTPAESPVHRMDADAPGPTAATQLPPQVKPAGHTPDGMVATRSPGPNALMPPRQFGILTLGKSAFYFDFPDTPRDFSMVQEFASTGPFEEVIHLYPGVPGSPLRWDILGEIDPQFPSLAENIALWLGFEGADGALVADCMLELQKDSQRIAALRDVSVKCLAWPSKMIRLDRLRSIFNVTETENFADWEQRLDDIAMRLGGFFLCEPGDAFVDVMSSAGPDGPQEHPVFSTREILSSDAANFYFVHIDSLDGPSTHRLGKFLGHLVKARQDSRRMTAAPVQVYTRGVRKKNMEALKEEVVAELGKTLNDFASRVKAMG